MAQRRPLPSAAPKCVLCHLNTFIQNFAVCRGPARRFASIYALILVQCSASVELKLSTPQNQKLFVRLALPHDRRKKKAAFTVIELEETFILI